ncbi:MAG: hypothetical protein GF329_05625 [Candidatus Lokiarchaeota archaeon]|nr:hypothetical protein [Candidatus Lokiarchaeota archaeon]
MKDSKSLLYQILNIVGFVLTIIVNSLANIIPLGGRNTGEISDLYSNLFTPAAYVFSIWGVIYILLGIFTVYQALPRNREKEFLGKITYLFLLISVANISWIFAWHYGQIYISLVVMIILLIALILTYIRLDEGKSKASTTEKLAVNLPFSVYFGWITVATVANVTAVLVAANWNRFGLTEEFWTFLILIVVVIITSLVILTKKDLPYGLVIVWATGGIIYKNLANQFLVATGIISIIFILIVYTLRVVIDNKSE